MTDYNIENGHNKNYSYRTYDTSNRPLRFNKVEEQAIQCSSCEGVVIAEYNLGTREITVYEHDQYRQQQKVLHPHPAGPIMKRRVMSRIAVEKRILHSFDEDDFHILTGTNWRKAN